MPEPALREEGQVEGDDGDGGAGDEERLQVAGANVADIRDGGVVGHGRVVRAVRVDDPV